MQRKQTGKSNSELLRCIALRNDGRCQIALSQSLVMNKHNGTVVYISFVLEGELNKNLTASCDC